MGHCLYQFSLNNPVRYLDPDGRAPKDEKKQPPKTPGDASNESKAIDVDIDPESDLGKLPLKAQNEVVGALLETVYRKMNEASPGSFRGASAGVGNYTGPATNPRNSKDKLRANIVSPNSKMVIRARLRKQGLRTTKLNNQLSEIVTKLKQGRGGATSVAGRRGGRKTVEVFVNGDGDFSSPRQAGRELGAVSAHEYGHGLGLGHIDANGPDDLAASTVLTNSRFGSKASLKIRQGL